MLRVTRWLSSTPTLAVCSQCSRQFKVPLTVMHRTKDAEAYLQEAFRRHPCCDESAGAASRIPTVNRIKPEKK